MAELDDDDPTLEVRRSEQEGHPVLSVRGVIDLATVATLRAAVAEAVTDPAATVVFDLDQVTFMDSTGLSLFLELTARSTPVLIQSPSEAVRRVIETTGLAATLPMQP